MFVSGAGDLRHLAVVTRVHSDRRGTFVKVLGEDVRQQMREPFEVAEVFWTRSERNVVRGLHFQSPPAAVAKVVWCTAGRALDVIVDLRPWSETFRAWAGFDITPDNGTVVYVPHGFAHGFCARLDDTVIGYAQSGSFDAAHDGGIRWDSAGVDWPLDADPILSERDWALPLLGDLQVPF